MSKLDKDQVIENFTKAYTAANGKEPTIEAGGGWYSVDGGKKVRLAALEEMATELSSTSAKSAPVEKPKAAEKKAAKPAAETKATKPAAEKKAAKPAAKKPAAKSKKAKSDFSVRAFWADKITEQNPGSKLPR